MTESASEAPLRSLGPLGPWLPSTETPQTTEKRRQSAPTILPGYDQPPTMPPIQCYIDGCEFETPDMGEALAAVVLSHHLSTEHAPQVPAAARTARVKMKKPDRPIVKEDSTDQDWAIFEFEWGRYCTAVGITAKEDMLRSEILNCCDPVSLLTLFPSTIPLTTVEI